MKKVFYLICCVLITACSSNDGESQLPPNNIIPAATCTDGIRNGDETQVDCGGPTCQSCPEVLAVIPNSGFSSPTSYDGYDLVWSDEFNDEALDANKWSYHLASGCPSLCGWGNNEEQYYTNKNTSFQEGNLVIQAKNEPINGFNYSSSRIHTDNKFEFQYGRIDIRASMPSATGTWVALWLLNKDYEVQNPGAEWPSGGEVDIMEYLGQDKTEILGTAHLGSDLSNHTFNSVYYRAPSGNYDENYYVYSIIWEEDLITWLVNDVPYHSLTPSGTNGQPYPFNDEFYMLMNLSVGGNLPVGPVASEYPAFLVIDYVRVFQAN